MSQAQAPRYRLRDQAGRRMQQGRIVEELLEVEVTESGVQNVQGPTTTITKTEERLQKAIQQTEGPDATGFLTVYHPLTAHVTKTTHTRWEAHLFAFDLHSLSVWGFHQQRSGE